MNEWMTQEILKKYLNKKTLKKKKISNGRSVYD